jgi:hypothetical protein
MNAFTIKKGENTKAEQPKIECTYILGSVEHISRRLHQISGKFGSVKFLFRTRFFYVRTKAITCEHSNMLLPSLASVRLIYFALMDPNCWKKSFFRDSSLSTFIYFVR